MPSVQMGVAFPLDLYEWVESRAKALEVTKGAFIREIVREKRAAAEKNPAALESVRTELEERKRRKGGIP